MNSKRNRDTMAGSVYDKQYFSDDEMQRMQDVVDAASSGKTDWDSAHRLVEQMRAGYGYSGGQDGSEYHKVEKPFSYDPSPTYERKFQNQLNSISSQILNRPKFQYNPESDPLYQNYKRSYESAGQKAMQDTLGQVSSRTGGLASSYAGVAAQQTYDDYMSALANKIPELQKLAYQMYQDEGDSQRANLNMLRTLEQDDYAKYIDLLGQYNTDRKFDYGRFIDQRDYDYKLGRDQIVDNRYADETAYNRNVYQDETDYNRALQSAKLLAAAGDFSGYKRLGYTDDEIATLKRAYDRTQNTYGGSVRKSSPTPPKYTDEGNGEDTTLGTYEQAEEYVKSIRSAYGGRAPAEIEKWLKKALSDGTISKDWYTRLFKYAI